MWSSREGCGVLRGRHNHIHADTANWLSGPSRAPASHHYPAVCCALALVLLTSLHQAPSLFCPRCRETSTDWDLFSLLSEAVPNAMPHGSWERADDQAMILQNGEAGAEEVSYLLQLCSIFMLLHPASVLVAPTPLLVSERWLTLL